MPLTSVGIYEAIQAVSPDLQGPVWPQVSLVVGMAVASWAATPFNITVTGSSVGAVGTGAVQGKLFVLPQATFVTSAFQTSGLRGPDSPRMARAIGIGVANAFTSYAAYRGICTGVGVGTDTTLSVTTNPSTLIQALQSSFRGFGLTGMDLPQLSVAIGIGVANLLSASTRGTGVITGVAGPLPGTGVSISQVV